MSNQIAEEEEEVSYTKEQAQELMLQGTKLTHFSFTDDEWCSGKQTDTDLLVVTEDGYEHNWDEFWSYRQGVHFNTGWRLYV